MAEGPLQSPDDECSQLEAAPSRQILPVFLSFDLMAGPTNNLMHVLHKHTYIWPRFIDRLSGFAKVKVKSLLIDWSKVMVENQDIYHV